MTLLPLLLIVMVAVADVVVVPTVTAAVTLNAPVVEPAVYKPADDTVPPVCAQVTAAVVPVTVAVNCRVPPGASVADVGEMVTETIGTAVTVTVAVADFVLSARLVTVTVQVPGVDGAVYNPVRETVPQLAAHPTPTLVVLLTTSVNCCVALTTKDTEVGLMETAIGGGVVEVV